MLVILAAAIALLTFGFRLVCGAMYRSSGGASLFLGCCASVLLGGLWPVSRTREAAVASTFVAMAIPAVLATFTTIAHVRF